jgi:hypothetical protein
MQERTACSFRDGSGSNEHAVLWIEYMAPQPPQPPQHQPKDWLHGMSTADQADFLHTPNSMNRYASTVARHLGQTVCLSVRLVYYTMPSRSGRWSGVR